MSVNDTDEQIYNQLTDSLPEPGWRVVAGSVRGTSHEKTGQPCQDAHHWQQLPSGILVAAIADGAGSAILGEVGATVATQAAVQVMESQLRLQNLEDEERSPGCSDRYRELLHNALKAALIEVEAEALRQQAKVRDLAATLILVIATPALVAAAQVGDGAAVVGDAAGELQALTAPQHGEYINETTFLISADALETAQVNVWSGAATHIAVFSDGLQRLALKLPAGNPHAPFFSPLFRFITDTTDAAIAQEQLMAFLHSPRITERTDDDLTLLLATLVR